MPSASMVTSSDGTRRDHTTAKVKPLRGETSRDTLSRMSRRPSSPRARRSATLVSIFMATIGLASVSARAGRVGIQGTLAADVAWTDNVMNAPLNPPKALMLRPPVADFFFELRPGAILTSSAPRFVSRLEYNFQADLFAHHSEGNSYSNTLGWQGFYLSSPRSELLFSVLGEQGRLNTFTLTQPSTGTPVTVVNALASSTNFASVSTSETLLYRLPYAWEVSQSLIGRAWFDLDRGQTLLPNTYEPVAQVGVTHRWKIDSLGLHLRLDFVYYDQVRDPKSNEVVTPSLKQLLNQLALRYRRDWTRFWNTELDIGIVEANNIGSASLTIIQPAGLGALRYSHRRGSGELSYQHMAQPNPLAASTFAMDEVALRGTLPFPERTHLFISATAAYQHAREIDFATGLTVSRADLAVVDATLRWQPRPEIGLSARYSLFDQIGHPDDGALAQFSVKRQVVMLGIQVSYPAVAVARVPSREGQRVDREDMETIPEPHSSEPAKQ
jgi:hypothetical protein